MTTPMMTCWTKGETRSRFSPLFRKPMISTPIAVPPMPPTPPFRLAPPMMTAAMVFSS
jgi:hypothetical protein